MVRKFAIDVPYTEIATFCDRWRITELALFGSAVGDHFGPSSDVDVLVSFAPNAEWDLVDAARMEEELAALFGRRVDLVTRRSVESSPNPIRREAILQSAVRVYVA